MKKISEFPTGIESMTFRTTGGPSIHWATRSHREQGHLSVFIVHSYIESYVISLAAISRCYKQLVLDEVYVISRIIKVEVRSCRLRLITLTETSIILEITNTEYNNRFIRHKWKNGCHVLVSSLTESANLTWLRLETMHRSHERAR